MKKNYKQINVNKLAAYSAMAAVVTAGAGPASAEIIYEDIEDITIEVGDMYDLDLDGDDVMDFHFRASMTMSTVSSSIWSFASAFGYYSGIGGSANQIIGTVGEFYNYGSALDEGVEVGPKAAWLSFPDSSNSAVLASNFYGDTYGYFPGQGEKFLGVQFMIGENLHYGWIRLVADVQDVYVTIMDFAYEDVPEEPILTGAMESVGIAGVAENNVQVYGYDATLYVNNQNNTAVFVKIYDLQGKLVYSDQLAGGNHALQSPVASSGIYMVTVETENGISTKELFLN